MTQFFCPRQQFVMGRFNGNNDPPARLAPRAPIAVIPPGDVYAEVWLILK